MPAMHINTMRPAHNVTTLIRERGAPQCGQALALVLMSPLHPGHFFTDIAMPSSRLITIAAIAALIAAFVFLLISLRPPPLYGPQEKNDEPPNNPKPSR
jgi:hypothetical protein